MGFLFVPKEVNLGVEGNLVFCSNWKGRKCISHEQEENELPQQLILGTFLECSFWNH
jgi:hypothetical protein